MQNPRRRGRDDPRPDVDDGPIDLAALRADDALIDALAAGNQLPAARPDGSDDLLVAVLAAWATDVAPDRSPMPPGSEPDVSGPNGSESNGSGPDTVHVRPQPTAVRHPYLPRLAAAVAFAVLALSGVAVGAGDAYPGDALWGVSKVFYADRARSVAAAVDVEVRLERVRVALRAGRPEIAAEELAAARAQLPAIRDDEGRDNLAQQEQQLSNALADTPWVAPTGAEETTESTDTVRTDTALAAPTETAAPPSSDATAEPSRKPAATDPTGGAGSTKTETSSASATQESTSRPDTTKPESKSPPDTTKLDAPATASPQPSSAPAPSDPAVRPAPNDRPPPKLTESPQSRTESPQSRSDPRDSPAPPPATDDPADEAPPPATDDPTQKQSAGADGSSGTSGHPTEEPAPSSSEGSPG